MPKRLRKLAARATLAAALCPRWPLRLALLAALLAVLDVAAVLLEGLGVMQDRPLVGVGMRAASALLAAGAFAVRLLAQREGR